MKQPPKQLIYVPRAPRSRSVIPSPAAQTAIAILSSASQYLRLLTDDQIAQWRAYAATQTAISSKTGKAHPRQWDKVFVGLAARYLHVNRDGKTPPRTPPLFPFAGDRITVTVRASGKDLVYTASGPTSGDVRVEILLQSLASTARTPQADHYRTQMFASFAPGSLSVTVPTFGGVHVPAYRFVCTDTGQDTPIVVLPKMVLV